MSSLLWFAIALTRAWTATYTRGLTADLRRERRDEIDCDLWEHQRLADLQRTPVSGTAIEILLRLFFGMPEDILWRFEAGSQSAIGKGTQVNESESVLIRGLSVVAIIVAALPVAMGLSAVFGVNGEWAGTWERTIYGGLWASSGVAIVAGLILSKTRPILGITMVVVGSIAVSAFWYWIAIFTVPIGIALTLIAFFRARQTGWPHRGDGGLPSATA